jgi:ribonuclease VapC
MIVETSVLVAIVLQEPEFEEFVFKIAEADERSMSAANYLEASLVLFQRRGEAALLELDRVIGEMEVAIVPVTSVQVRIARNAFLAYGKGLGNAAQLNLGDWFGYALAIQTGEPLLFKGDDFVHTDVLKA